MNNLLWIKIEYDTKYYRLTEKLYNIGINIYKLNDFEINFVKEKEYIIKNKKLSEEEAYEKAFKDGVDKIQNNLSKDEEILVKKVLKKSIFDSTIYLELFVVTKEEIGEVEIVEE